MCYLATSKEESEMFIKTAQAENDENTSKIVLTCLPQDYCDDLMKYVGLSFLFWGGGGGMKIQ